MSINMSSFILIRILIIMRALAIVHFVGLLRDNIRVIFSVIGSGRKIYSENKVTLYLCVSGWLRVIRPLLSPLRLWAERRRQKSICVTVKYFCMFYIQTCHNLVHKITAKTFSANYCCLSYTNILKKNKKTRTL